MVLQPVPVREPRQRVAIGELPQLVVQPGVVERGRRLADEELGQLHVAVAERMRSLCAELDDPDGLAAHDEREHHQALVADALHVLELGDVGRRVVVGDDERLVRAQHLAGRGEAPELVRGLEVDEALIRVAAERDDPVAFHVPRREDAVVRVRDEGDMPRQAVADVLGVERRGEVVRHLDDVPKLLGRVGQARARVPEEQLEQAVHDDQGRRREERDDGAVEPGAPRDDLRRQEAERTDDRADDHQSGQRRSAHVGQRQDDRDQGAERERGPDDRLGDDSADRRDLRGDRDAGREVSFGLRVPGAALDEEEQRKAGRDDADRGEREPADREADERPEDTDRHDDHAEDAQGATERARLPLICHRSLQATPRVRQGDVRPQRRSGPGPSVSPLRPTRTWYADNQTASPVDDRQTQGVAPIRDRAVPCHRTDRPMAHLRTRSPLSGVVEMNDQNRDRENEMDRQGQATKPGASANQSEQSGSGQSGMGTTDQRAGSGWQSDQGTGKGSTGDSGVVGGESWQDRSRQGNQEDTETAGTAEQGTREQTSRS